VSEIRPLGPAQADQVWELSRQVYPESFSLSSEDLRSTLSDLPPLHNYCLGAFEGERLVAYLMCWLDTSQVEERSQEPVLLLDDIVVTPESRRYLFSLLRKLRQQIVQRGQTHLAMEGTHRHRAEQLFRDHPRVVERLGYRQAATHHYFGEREQEELCWARYEPAPSQGIS